MDSTNSPPDYSIDYLIFTNSFHPTTQNEPGDVHKRGKPLEPLSLCEDNRSFYNATRQLLPFKSIVQALLFVLLPLSDCLFEFLYTNSFNKTSRSFSFLGVSAIILEAPFGQVNHLSFS